MLLGSTQPHLDSVDKLKDDDEKHLVETMIIQACNTFSYCAVRSSIKFSLHIGKVSSIDLMFVIYVEVSTLKTNMRLIKHVFNCLGRYNVCALAWLF